MATVNYDIQEGPTLQRTGEGVELKRVAHVTGLTGNADQILYQALLALPNQGGSHPSVPNLEVASVMINPLTDSNQQVRAVVTYKPPRFELNPPNNSAPPQIEVGTTVQSVETNKDKDGNLLKVSYEYADRTDSAGNPFVEEIIATVNKDEAHAYLRLHRKETADPGQKSAAFTNTVNSTTFRGDSAGFWRCVGINGRSPDGGLSFNVTYEFQRNPDKWTTDLIFIDPETGNAPGDVDKDGNGNGIVRDVELYQSADFGALNVE